MNPHALAGTSPSSWRVCLFRHSDVAARCAWRGHNSSAARPALDKASNTHVRTAASAGNRVYRSGSSASTGAARGRSTRSSTPSA